jgi:Protein of unknown function (DUF3352)
VFKKVSFMKRRSFFTVLAAVAAVLLLSGLLGFVWLFAQSPLGLLRGSTNPNPQSMIFIPKQAPVMGSLLVNPDRLAGLQLALVPPDQRQAQRVELDGLRDGLLGGDLRYGRDVQPWLGDEVTLAVTTLDIDRDSANGNQPGYLLSLLTKNTTRSREFLQRFWQQRAVMPADLVFEQYQGTQIIYGQVQAGQVQSADAAAPALTLASAVVGNRFVLFANSPKVLRDAINNVQAVELNLGNDPDYQRAIAALPANRVGLSYVNLPQLAALSGDSKALAALTQGAYEHLAIGLGLDRSGLVANTAVVGGVAQAAQLVKPVAALRYLPPLTPVVLSGVNLAQTWTDLSQGLQDYRLAAQLVQQPIAAWGQQLQLDLAQDLFPWVKGSYVFGLLPDQAQDWIFLADKATNPDYVQGLAKLNAIAKAHQLTVTPVQLGEQTVSAWTQQLAATAKSADQPTVDATAIGAWVELDQAVIFASSIAAMQQSLAVPQSVRKSLDRSLSQSVAPIDDRNNGYLYVDWRTMKPRLASKAPIVRILDLVAQPLAQNLRSVTLSGYGGEGDVHRGVVFLRLR